MKILSTSDLHGNDLGYSDKIFKSAVLHGVKVVVNAGDMFPKSEPIFHKQERFLKFLEKFYFPKYEKANIHYVCTLGNDDLAIYDKPFDDLCNKFEFIHNIPQKKIEINGFEFIGFNYVVDYPFGLKDRCRMDTKDFSFPKQYGKAVYSSDEGWHQIEDWFKTAKQLPTIQEELAALVKPKDPKKAIYVMHMPPADIGLDICANKDRPGSPSVRKFLDRMQPILSIHGHIHESFEMSGLYFAKLGETTCVQAGQGGPSPVFCLIDLQSISQNGVHVDRYQKLQVKYDRTKIVKAHTDKNLPYKYVRIPELPPSLQKVFYDFLFGRQCPLPAGEDGVDCAWLQDYKDFESYLKKIK